jgi:hypothetical protein
LTTNIIEIAIPLNRFCLPKLVQDLLRVFTNPVFGPNPCDIGLYKQALIPGLIPFAKVATWDDI